MTLRVAIAYNFNDRDWFGGRNYFASLLRAVAACRPAPAIQFVLMTGKKTVTSLPEDFPTLEIVRTSLMDRMALPWLLRQADVRLLDADRLLARLLRRQRIDVLSHSMPLGASPGLKTIAWLYDFQFLHLPDYWHPKHVRWARQWYASACRQCDAVIVSSTSALADLHTFAPDGRAARHVLPFVSNPVDFEQLTPIATLRERYRLPAVYFFLPNQFWANKNHRLAIDALALLTAAGVDATIVCTGKTLDGRQPEYFENLMRHRDASGMTERLRVLGIVPYADIQALMVNARAVINPSRFEGWSTTVEEAKTLHKDLLLSDIPVHREQAPSRGVFFGIDDAPALAGAMQRALAAPESPVVIDEMQADYQRRLRIFGEQYLDILQTACPELRTTRAAVSVELLVDAGH